MRLSNTIKELDLRNNPLIEYGEGDKLGWRDLKGIFGNKVKLSQKLLKDHLE